MKDKKNMIIPWIITSLIFVLVLISIIFILKYFEKDSTEIQVKPNYEAMYNMCKSKCSNYTTFDIASKEEVGMKVVLYQNKTIKEVECLCSNNNMSRSVKLW